MILVDTSVWVDHLQRGNATLAQTLSRGEVLAHPFVLGELTLGNLRQRTQVLEALNRLPMATAATVAEVLNFIARQSLFGRGIGYVDAHLLAAARLTPGSWLWTLDKRLQVAAISLDLAWTPSCICAAATAPAWRFSGQRKPKAVVHEFSAKPGVPGQWCGVVQGGAGALGCGTIQEPVCQPETNLIDLARMVCHEG